MFLEANIGLFKAKGTIPVTLLMAMAMAMAMSDGLWCLYRLSGYYPPAPCEIMPLIHIFINR